ncbi:MAG TPA: ABC transporter permease [Sulfolobales archaeon]|nr:ABC transporter permease [Sulfolobales archaeon]
MPTIGKGFVMNSLLRMLISKGYPGRVFLLAGIFMVIPIIFMALTAPLISPYDPTISVSNPLSPPSTAHPLGTDNLGRDVLSRIIWGSRIVLAVVLLSVILSASVGIPLGLLSGYMGGKLDRILTMVMDSMYAFPGLILAIALASVLGPSIVNAAIAIAIGYIPIYFRMARGQALQIKEQAYVELAKVAGASSVRIMFRHILPNAMPTLSVIVTLNMADAILTEAALSFLGFVVTPPTPDWGFDMRAGQPFLPSGYWWTITFPGIFILILSLGLSLAGEGLNDMLAGREI